MHENGWCPGALQDEAAEHALLKCTEQLAKRFDSQFGGFGGAPK